MRRKWKAFLSAALWAAAWSQVSAAQLAPAALLDIDVENEVDYVGDLADVSRFATDPNATPARGRTFQSILAIGDIVTVNGRPAKGTHLIWGGTVRLFAAPGPGLAIGDTRRDQIVEETFEILQPDGTPVGSIMLLGLVAGPGPPGLPGRILGANKAVVGGTGAFLGVRGQSATRSRAGARAASMAEDPANRRTHGGSTNRFVLHLIPLFRPEIVTTASGPAVLHSGDFSLVTSAKPARAGEVLILVATGLGPTRPGVDPGEPFPVGPPFPEATRRERWR